MFTYFTNFWKQPFRGVLLKSDPEEIRKIHKKASFAETFFSPVKLHDYKEGLRYGCFYDEFSKKQLCTAASIVLTEHK